MNRKYLPALFMLTAAAVTCIITYVMEFTVTGKLFSLLSVMIIFGTLGYVLKATLDSFEKQNQQKKAEEEALAEESFQEAGGTEQEADGRVLGQDANE